MKRQRAAEEDTSGGFIDRKQAYKDRELILRAKLAGRDQDIIDAAIRKGKEGGGFETTTAAAAAKLIENFIAKAAISGVDLTPEQRAKIINDVLDTRLGGQRWGGKESGGFEPATAAATAKLIENSLAKATIGGVDLTPEQRAKIIDDVLETRLGYQRLGGGDRLPVGGSGTPEQKLKTKFDNDLLTRAGIPDGQITEREKILGGAQPDERANRAGEVETLGGDRTNAADYLALDEFKRVSKRPGVTNSEIAEAYDAFTKKVGDNAAAREAAEIRAEERAWENTTDYSSSNSGSGDTSNSSEAPIPAVPQYQANPEPTPDPAPTETTSSSPGPEPRAGNKEKPEVKATVTTPEDEVIIVDSNGTVIAGSEAEESNTVIEATGTVVIRNSDGEVVSEETTSGEGDEEKSKNEEKSKDNDKSKDNEKDKTKDDENKDDENKDDENKDDENSKENGSKPVNPYYDEGIVLNKKTDLEIWQERRDAQRGIQSSGPDSDLGASEALGRVEGTAPPQRQGPQIDYADQPRGQNGPYIDPFANRNPSGGIIGFESSSTDNSSNDTETASEYKPETPVQRTLAPASEDPNPKPETGNEKQE